MSTSIVNGSQGIYRYELIRFNEFQWKKLFFQFSNYQQTPSTSQPFVPIKTTIQFPVAFDYIPSIVFNNTGLTVTLSQNNLIISSPSYVTVPVDVSVNGIISIEGF